MKKVGRPPKKFISLNELRKLCQLEGITSRRQYLNWHEMIKPRDVPKRPNRVYKNWKNWNDLLGTNYEFGGRYSHLRCSFKDALVWARRSNISKAQEWFHSNDIPIEIPKRPDLYYREKGWKGWGYFLGTGKHKAIYKAETAKILKERTILMFVIPPDNPPNIIKGGIFPTINDCKEYLNNTKSQFLKAFHYDDGYDWKSVVLMYGTDYGNSEYLINNVNEMLFNINLDMVVG